MQQHEKLICLECELHLPETGYHQQSNNPLYQIFSGRVKIENVTSLFFYRKGGGVQQLLHALKYKGKKEIGIYFGEYYGKLLKKSELFNKIDMIIPVPLHPKKLKKRGYNQSESIAEGLSRGMDVPYFTQVVARRTFTDTQTKKSRISRWENVKDVFEVINPLLLQNKNILLCDDVLTTGATIEAMAQKIIPIEGVKIWVVALASVI
jgi:ComF family protein